MTSNLPQGDLRLLKTEQAQRLLASTINVRLAYIALDGTPRVIPTWFHWTGEEIVMATYVAGQKAGIRHPAQRVAALRAQPAVALTIDTNDFPPQALTIRGTATITEVEGLAEEYVLAAHRYIGAEATEGLVKQMNQDGTRQARIAVRPSWVGLLDFQSRLPSPLGGVQ